MKPLLALLLGTTDAARLHRIEKQIFPHLKSCGEMHGTHGQLHQHVQLG